MVTGPADIKRPDAQEPELIEIEAVDKDVDCTYRVILGHIVIESGRKQRRLLTPDPFHKS